MCTEHRIFYSNLFELNDKRRKLFHILGGYTSTRLLGGCLFVCFVLGFVWFFFLVFLWVYFPPHI